MIQATKAWRSKFFERPGQLLVLISALILVGTTLAATESGCGSSPSTTGGGTGNATSIVVYATDWPVYQSLDPSKESIVDQMHNNVYETLARYDAATKKAVPLLAESWDTSSDGLTWTFHLNRGVKFHDGSELDSQAVKFSIERTISLGLGTSYMWGAIKKIETPDGYTVVFKLKEPAPIDLIATGTVSAWIYSPTAVQKYGKKCFQPGYDAGSGPYVLKAATPNEATLIRFEGYWGGWQGLHAKAPTAAVIRQVLEPSVRVQGLEQGEFQVISSAPPTDLAMLKSNPKLKVWPANSFMQLIYTYTTNRAPTNDPYLRQALVYAYPYQQVLQLALGGYASQASGPCPNAMSGYEEFRAQFPPVQQDMAKARAALAKSAYPKGGITLKLFYFSGLDKVAQAAQLYKAALADLNIDLVVTGRSIDVLFNQMISKDPPQDIYSTEYYPSVPFVTDNLNTALGASPVYNTSYWSTPKTNSMIAEATRLAGTDKSAAIQKAIDVWRVVEQEHGWMWATNDQSVPVASTSLKGFAGFNPNYNNWVDFYNVWMEQ